jgi:radical SAM protein with 4Fe4S-binding SPASM domain
VTVEHADLAWFRQHVAAKLAGRRFPLSGSIELVTRCNFRCVHCYLGSDRELGAELPTGRLLALLDEMAEAGTLSLILTGGEPLLHPDFRAIHAHATRRGFIVGLFTNGSLVDAELARFLGAHPPQTIEVSLYGGSPEGYAHITGSAKHFDATVRGVELLLREGLVVRLKAVLLSPLVREADRMRRLAESLGTTLRFDPRVDPTLSGDVAPLALRTDPATAVAIELGDPRRLRKLAEAAERRTCNTAGTCGAGQLAFHLDPRGRLSPCMMVRAPDSDASVQGFRAAWQELGKQARVALAADSPCRRCDIQYCCSYCPGLERLDDDVRRTQVAIECELARLRHRVLEQQLGAQSLAVRPDDEPERRPR